MVLGEHVWTVAEYLLSELWTIQGDGVDGQALVDHDKVLEVPSIGEGGPFLTSRDYDLLMRSIILLFLSFDCPWNELLLRSTIAVAHLRIPVVNE